MSGGMSDMDVRLPESADDAVTQRWMAWSTSHPDVSDPPAVYRAGLLAGVKLAMRAGSDIGNAVPSIVLLIDLLNEAAESEARR